MLELTRRRLRKMRILASSYNNAKFYTPVELQAVERIDRQVATYNNNNKIPPNLTMSVTHGDLGLRHVPFLSNGQVYIFDWVKRWLPVARDLTILRTDLYVAENISFSRWEELRGWLFSGYSSIINLTKDDLQAVQTFTIRFLLEQVFHHNIMRKIMRIVNDEPPYPKQLNAEVVKSVVAEKYGFRVTDIEVLSYGIRNGVWLVKSEQGDWAAKVYATTDFKYIQEEVDLLAYLLAHDINVPAVHPSLQGRLVEELVSGGYTYPLVVMRYEKLRFTTPSQITQAEMETIGKEIARAHTILRRYPQRHLLT